MFFESGFRCIFEKAQKVSEVNKLKQETLVQFASMADLKNGNFLTYAYILLYIALSSGQIFFNKVTVDHFKFTFSSPFVCFPVNCAKTLCHIDIAKMDSC